MVDVEGGDEFHFDLYHVKEITYKLTTDAHGNTIEIPQVRDKFLINPPRSSIEKENVEVISRKRIKLQIMEVNKVGGKIVEPRYLIGMRIVDGNKITPVFHIMVRDDKEFREKVIKELEYYLKVSKLLS